MVKSKKSTKSLHPNVHTVCTSLMYLLIYYSMFLPAIFQSHFYVTACLSPQSFNHSSNQGWEFALWFLSESLVFCGQKSEIAICSLKRANRSRCSFVKSDKRKSFTIALLKIAMGAIHSQSLFCKEPIEQSNGAKSNESNLLLGVKRGKAWKNCQKHGEKYKCFWANCWFFKSESKSRANHWC